MSLLAESLVEEWLNRKGFFTIRGLKQRVDEIDLLAVAPRGTAETEAWHVEVQASFRPVSYITPLTETIARDLGKKKTSAFARSPDVLSECVRAWVQKKFRAEKKVGVRRALWPDADWRFVVVHGVVKHPTELQLIAKDRVTLVSLDSVLSELCSGAPPPFTGSAGGDLAELIQHYARVLHRRPAQT